MRVDGFVFARVVSKFSLEVNSCSPEDRPSKPSLIFELIWAFQPLELPAFEAGGLPISVEASDDIDLHISAAGVQNLIRFFRGRRLPNRFRGPIL
jgi:hypothetical protein